jgi:hypothetical protein
VSEGHPSLQPRSIASKDAQRTSWKRCMNKTMRESDPEKLVPLVYACEEAIVLRWQEMGSDSSSDAEREVIEAACRDLWAIKIHKLGWPSL